MKPLDNYTIVGIIPARYASTRFPGKPLAMVLGKPMIQRVYEQASLALDTVFVATDDNRIQETVTGFGGRVIMTSPDHQSGTDRCAEAVKTITVNKGISAHIVVNIQGDEPFIRPEQIKLLASCFTDESVEIATLIREVGQGEDLTDPNQPKVIVDVRKDAVYFSRSVIPYLRDVQYSEWPKHHVYYKHVGLYAYRTLTLHNITTLPRSPLEKAESLEQNRWLENGFKIRTAVTEWESVCIDTPGDLEKAERLFNQFK